MGRKNNIILNNMKMVQKELDAILPNVYGSIALALFEDYGWKEDDILELIQNSQIRWGESIDNRESIAKICSEITGIDVRLFK